MFEGSHVPLNKWFAALFFMCESNKGVSANILHRSLGISYKTATTMFERVETAVPHVEDSTLQDAVKAGVQMLDTTNFPAAFMHDKKVFFTEQQRPWWSGSKRQYRKSKIRLFRLP